MISVLLLSHSDAISQSDILHFENSSLEQVVKSIEAETEYVFNYDPKALREYNFSGQIAINHLGTELVRLFYYSPYIFDIESNTIVVYKDEKKRVRLCGTIRDALTKEPLVAATISAQDLAVGIQSGLSGFFDLDLDCYKGQIIEVSYVGFQNQQFVVQEFSSDDCLDIYMDYDDNLLKDDIVIKDYVFDGVTEGSTYGSLSLDYTKITQNHSTVEHDILKSVQLLPGITSLDDSAANLQIRGSSPGQNLVLWEGAPLYNVGHIFGMISSINPFIVSNIQVFKGAHSPQYDNRVGGIIDVSLSDVPTDKVQGSIGTTLTEAHANLEIPIIKEKLGFEIAGRRNFSDLYSSEALQNYTNKVFQFTLIDDFENSDDSESLNTNQSLNYYDYSAKLLYNPSERLAINCGVFKSHQDFNFSFSFDGDPFLSSDNVVVDTEVISGEAKFSINQHWESTLSIYHSEYGNLNRREETEGGQFLRENEQRNSIEEQSVTFANALRIAPNVTFGVGYEYNKKALELRLAEGTNIDPMLIPFGIQTAGFHNAFQSVHLNLAKLKVEIGNRSSYIIKKSAWAHSPRMNVQFVLNDAFKLKGDAGIYHQFISQLFTLGDQQIQVDNPLWILDGTSTNLSQRGNKIALGLVFQKDGWLIDIEGYYSKTDSINTISPLFAPLSDELEFSKGSSTVRGLDILLKKQFSKVNAWFNYSLGKARYDFLDIDQFSFPAPNDIRHNLSVLITCKLNRLHLSMNTRYHSGMPFTKPELEPNLDDPNPDPGFAYFLDYNAYNAERLEHYVRLDVNAAYRFELGRRQKLQCEISTSLINVFNQKNVFAREFFINYDENTDIYNLASIDKELLPITPLLLLRCSW